MNNLFRLASVGLYNSQQKEMAFAMNQQYREFAQEPPSIK